MERKALKIFWIALAVSLTACSEDELLELSSIDPNMIAFKATPASDASFKTRSGVKTDESLVFPCGGDTLYLHRYSEDNLIREDVPETRGVPVNSPELFQSTYGAFGATAYLKDNEQMYFSNDRVGRYNGSVYSGDNQRYWPDDRTLSFYAYAPYEHNGENVLKEGALENLTYNHTAGSIAFDYTTPKSSDSKTDAEKQPDLMFAQKECNRQSSDGTVHLKFYHALAGVRFVAGNVAACKIESITIKNVIGKGSCIYTPQDSPEDASSLFKWTPDSEANDYTQTFGTTLDNSYGESIQNITVKPEATFMFIPQTLGGGAQIEVKLTMTGNDGVSKEHTLICSLDGVKWEAGKIYTYKISTESINWEYHFEVTPSITLPLGTVETSYDVKSYRVRVGDPTKIEPVAWSATQQKGSQNESDYYLSDRSVLAGSGTSATIATETYKLTMRRTDMQTSHDGDKTLQENQPKSIKRNDPWNLASGALYKDKKPETTANCYVVDAPGYYYIPLVYGNALKNGEHNPSAYGGDTGHEFYDYKDRVIQGPYIDEPMTDADKPYDCTLIWCDAFYIFEGVGLSSDFFKSNDDHYGLMFYINAEHIQQANAIVAVRNEAGDIMWSWHIWITEYDINASIGIDDWQDGTQNAYQLMPKDLGWLDGKRVQYLERDVTFSFVQDISGESRSMDIHQNGMDTDYAYAATTYYQWGRKDPIAPLKERSEHQPAIRESEIWDSLYQHLLHDTDKDKITPGRAIQHPQYQYYDYDGKPGNWMDTDYLKTDGSGSYYFWNNQAQIDASDATSVKTIYDPSPAGYKVPKPRVFEIFTNSSGIGKYGDLNGTSTYPEGYTFVVYSSRNRKGNAIPLLATGQRSDRMNNNALGPAGGLWALDGVYFWSCYGELNGGTDYIGGSLCIRPSSDNYSSFFAGVQIMSRPIRPIKE